MAHFDEYFYTNLYHGLDKEDKKTIKENIVMFQEGIDLLDSTGSALSFATIFTGPVGKAGAFLSNALFEDLKETSGERLNNKIKIIARNEESAKLIKTLYETKGQTPHIIILSELIKRQRDEINELSKKYDRLTVQKICNDVMEHKCSTSDKISSDVTILNNWIHLTEENKYNNIQNTYQAFRNLSQIGNAVQCEELTKMADLALSSMNIYESFNALSCALTTGTITDIINPITSLICVGVGLFNMFKKKKAQDVKYIQTIIKQLNMINKQLNMINKQLQSMQKEIRENFKIVFQYLDNIVDKLQMQHTISLNIYHKIEQIEKSISNLTVICEYYGKQNLLQDLYRTVYKITQGTQEYFKTMGKSEFNNMVMDIFYWLENHSFDYGTNGYIYALGNGSINDNFGSQVCNRLGYLALLLHYQYAKDMVNPMIFNICVDALEVLIHKGLPYYGSLPMPYNRIIPIMNKANLTEQFIDHSRNQNTLENIINQQYIPIVEKLKTSLNDWVNQCNQKYGITNFSYITILNTVDEIISATPIVTSQVQATCISPTLATVLNHLPYNLSSVNGSFSPIWKICELAKKLGIGYYDFKFNFSHGKPFGDWNIGISVDIYIQVNFVLNGTSYTVYTELWRNPKVIKGFGNLTGNCILGNWHHDYTSTRWSLINYAKSNTHFENIIKKACADKLSSIRQEMTSMSYTIGTQVNSLCDKLQEYYIIILKLFEINDTKLDNLNSGVWVKTRLGQLINFENTHGYNVISFCDFVKTKALQVKAEYNQSIIKTQIRNSINKLNELSKEIIRYQEEYKYIEENDKIISIEKNKLLEQEKELMVKLVEEKKQQDELNIINNVGMQVGRTLTIHNIIKHLEQIGKNDEANIIKNKYADNINRTEEIDKLLETNQQTQMMFSSSFCNGSSMVLLEMSIALQKYPATIYDIQLMGHKILNQVLSSTKTISGTVNSFLTIQNS